MESTAQENRNILSESETSLLLDTYMYLNYYDAREGQTLTEIMHDLSGLPDYHAGGIHEREYEILKQAVNRNTGLGQLQISAQSHQFGFDSGTRACLFREPCTETVYVVYRGTGDGEWMDNGLGMTLDSTLQQRRALQYFEKAMDYGEYTKDHRIIVTGHSKGGNKAQYVTMESSYGNLIDKCFSVDGQGFSEDAVERWKEKYADSGYEKNEYDIRTGKLYGINGENDFVHVMGHSIIPTDHIRYLHTPVGNHNFTGYHDIKYMFAAEDGKGNLLFRGQSNDVVGGLREWGLFARKISQEMMMLPAEERSGCAAVIMQLMELRGEYKTGMNGEKVTLENWWDFLLSGIPAVAGALSMTGEGGGIMGALYRKGNETAGIYAVDPHCLAEQVGSLEIMAAKIKRLAEETELAEERLRTSLKYGFPYSFGICGKIKKEKERLRKEADQLLRMAETLETVAQIYAACEHAVAGI